MEETKNSQNQFNKMINTPIPKLIGTLAVPTVISMLVTSIYNMADTYFVSKINTEASAAVGIVFPIMTIIQALGFTLGMGGGSIISRRLGEKKNLEASQTASVAFFSSLLIGLSITILGNIFSSQFMEFVGASENVLPYANAYARYCALYGDSAVAAMAIVTKIIMFVASVMIGIGQGFTPVAGYNYGAKRYDRVRKAYWFTVFTGIVILGISSLLGVIFAKEIITFFRNDLEVIKIGTVALRWQIAVLPLHPLIVATNMLLQATGHIPQATFLSCNRQGVYFIPLILVLPHLLGVFGVEIAQACSDFLSVITAIPYLIWFLRKMKKM